MSNATDELKASLTRLSHFTTPPAEVAAAALAAYAARVTELEDLVAHKDARIGEEVSFQRFIRDGERERALAVARRHESEKRDLVAEIGFAATIRDRVMTAHFHGRKTIKIDALLEGRPNEELAA